MMDAALELSLRDQLTERQRRLAGAAATAGEPQDLLRLLHEVDSALKRMDARTFGLCELCHEDIDGPDLAANPLLPWCLCNLTPAQQAALSSDLDLATRIQLSLLPKQDLACCGYEVHHRYHSVGPVSGDFLDVAVREAEGDGLFLLLGDVSGKGVAASFLMARLNALFRSLVELRLPVHELVERANRLFSEAKPSTHYATLVCARAAASGAVEVCNAGHLAPLVVHDGEVTPIGSSGFPVGLFAGNPYQVQRIDLKPGDTLFLYTDGLTEAHDRDDQEYGIDRLTRVLTAHAKESPGQLAARCIADLRRFLGGAPLGDDMTLMVVRRSGW